MAIRITPEEVRGIAGKFGNEAENVGNTIRSMEGLLSQLQGIWEGAAASSFTARFEALKPGFVQAQQLISEIQQALNTAANTFEEQDQSIKF